ncbi:MAG: hypothetical protein ACJ768_09285 [Gaiellaceae bacterium]
MAEQTGPRLQSQMIAGVQSAAHDVAQARAQLIAAMTAAIAGGAAPELVAVAAMPSEPSYALTMDLAGSER